MMGEPPHGKEEGYRPSVAGQAAFPRHENLPESLPASEIIIGLVKDTMSEPGTYNGSYQKRVQQWIKQGDRYAFPLEKPFENVPSENESRYEKYRIPTDRQRPDMEYLGIDVPMYEKKVGHLSLQSVIHVRQQYPEVPFLRDIRALHRRR